MNKKQEFYYKIVSSPTPGVYTSTTNNYLEPGKYRVTYYINAEVVAPGDSKLFVFDTKDDAQSYLTAYLDHFGTIFKCKVTNPVKAKYVCLTYAFTEFWKRRKQKKSTFGYNTRALKGTVLVDSVTLIEKL